MAARIREELSVDVDEQSGSYGEFTVLVDGRPVRSGNLIATALALIPSATEVIEAVRQRLDDAS